MADVFQIDPRQAMLQQAADAQRHAASVQIAQLCVAIVTNRDKLMGEAGSARSAAIVDEADRVLLAWLNGLSEEKN